tara:strand:- start:318 stop:1112 length:795 start_codon:yes stop_codon:yes gene_type:complete
MKKYLVIGNPIEHSLSPKLQNYWIKKSNLEAIYGKLEANEHDFKELCNNIKNGELDGLNVTVPFKKSIIPYLDILSGNSLRTQSVNTISLENGNLVGHNTDIDGFELSMKKLNYDVSDKSIFIIGAGGVVPSIIYSLKRMNSSKIYLTNRTKEKALNLKSLFNNLDILEWGNLPDFDMVINATSLGLKENDKFEIDFKNVGKNKFYYDVIYKPYKTEFSEAGNIEGNKYENGLNMFLFQAQKAFNIWHNIEPEINEDVIKFITS